MTGRGPRILEVGWAGAALEAESGDAHLVAELPAGALVAVIDGLGHGIEAAAAARAAARVLAASAGEPIEELFARCHAALRGTRGAVMSVAALDAAAGRMTWAGVGNVEAFLVRADPRAAPPRESIALRGGIVGYHLPRLHVSTLAIVPGDTLLMATDGIHDGFGEVPAAPGSPRELADAILARFARGSDDALALVARYLGGAGGPEADGGEGDAG